MGCHALLLGIFQTQESNLCLRRCRQILYHLSHLGSLLCRKSGDDTVQKPRLDPQRPTAQRRSLEKTTFVRTSGISPREGNTLPRHSLDAQKMPFSSCDSCSSRPLHCLPPTYRCLWLRDCQKQLISVSESKPVEFTQETRDVGVHFCLTINALFLFKMAL